jgi:type IV pilus assembly protein PilM
MTKLFYKDKPLIGLDISQTGIKVMSVDPKKWLVQGYGSLDLDPAKVQNSLDNAEDTYLAESISTLLKDNIIGSLGSDHVVVGLPTGRTFSRTFSLPASEEAGITSAVEVEVDQYIPIPLNSLYVDHEIIERTKDQLTIVMSAVPSNLVDSCIAAVRAAGLTPVVAEPSINAVARVIEATEEGHLSTLIVDIGPASTDIAVLDNGAIRVTGGVGIGGNTFTLDIAKKMNIALENAHQLKVLNGLSAGPRQAKISAALHPSLQRIITEVRKVIRYYNERLNDNRNIEQVLIVGGGANVPGIGEFFTNELVMPARVASPWQKLDFGTLQQPNKQFRPRYITVAGLASVQNEDLWK